MNRRAKRIAKRTILGLSGAMIGLVIIQASLSPWYLFGLNIDNSLPGYVYLVIRDELPARLDVAAFRTPPNPYYPEDVPFIKVVLGIPGDNVTRNGREYSINGVAIGWAKEQTRRGQPLTPGPTGSLPPGHYFFWTPHIDSYDSRYDEIGWITTDRILGRAVRLL
ncbi:MAG: S26 family signal peptidase [Gammaproteobacteria bacterium]